MGLLCYLEVLMNPLSNRRIDSKHMGYVEVD